MARQTISGQDMDGHRTRAPEARGSGSPYEVRCPRCNVSFPVETRRCVHCGGATAASGTTIGIGEYAGAIETKTGGITAPTQPGAISTAPSPFEGSDELDAQSDVGSPLPSNGIGAALLRSFGSLFWIIALIGFSFLRNCRDE